MPTTKFYPTCTKTRKVHPKDRAKIVDRLYDVARDPIWPEVREGILLGTEVALSDGFSAHEAFKREVIASEHDWSDVVLAQTVPSLLLQGDQDQRATLETVTEMQQAFAHLGFEIWPDTGQLLFFAHWQSTLDRLGQFLPKSYEHRATYPCRVCALPAADLACPYRRPTLAPGNRKSN